MKKDLLPRFPSRRTETLPVPEHPSITRAHDLLVESLSVIKAHPDLAPTLEQQLEEAVAHDARQLAAHLVPPQVAETLELEVPTQVAPTELLPPTLNDTYLLADALDTTGDPAVHDALGYILDYMPPAFSDTLRAAYTRAEATGNPVMVEHHRIGDPEDRRLDPLIQDWVNSQFEKNSPN